MAALGACALAGLVGCTPGPDPEPTPTETAAFASEEEAFEAAEAVYQSYLDASEARSEGDLDADPASLLSGEALEDDIEAQRALAEADLTIRGPSEIVEFHGTNAEIAAPVASIDADVCIDISESRVTDTDGNDVTPDDRPSRYLLRISFTGSSTGLLITRSSASEGAAC